MSGTQLAMVSEWMPNGNINQFVKKHRNANRFELVSFSFVSLSSSFLVNNCPNPVVERRREGFDLYAQSGYGPWGSQGRTFFRDTATLDL